MLHEGTKCSTEFCWNCLVDYRVILRYDNSRHGADCEFHTDNLR